MDKKSFKIGDKVKLKPGYIRRFRQGTKTGEVVLIGATYIRVVYGGQRHCCGFPYMPHELEHAVKVGEQLLFSFMEGD